MSEATAEVRRDPAGVRAATDADGLLAIQEPGCGAAIWQRTLTPEFSAWIDALTPEALPAARLVLPKGSVPSAIAQLFDQVGLTEGPERAWLEQDITDLAARFGTLMNAPYLRVRLDVITTNACRKFHIDAVTARLLVTYRGTGTQYATCVEGEPSSEIHTVDRGAPMILRGTLWPANPSPGLRHRSPPIDGTGETRLMLVLDPIFDPEEEI